MSQFDYRQFLGLLPETRSENYFDEKRQEKTTIFTLNHEHFDFIFPVS